MPTTAAVNVPAGGGAAADGRRWAALCFIALAQLMVVLDATVVNIALPSAQRALGISDGDRQWVITAYTLVFGGLLLLGGRVADLVGRRRTFMVGLLGFAGASALGGAAAGEGMLFAARALQGAFGALLAPSALSLLAVTFTEPRERARAFGVYGAIAGGGSAVGLILGGVLTEYLSWRWSLYVNVPIAIGAFAGALFLVDAPARSAGPRTRLDVPGAVLVTGGLVSLVYGFTRAESDGWHDHGVLGLFATAAVLLILFVVVEGLTRAPLLPLRVVVDRNRGGAYISVGLAVIAMFGIFLFLTYYLQVVKGYSPVRAGLAFLPFTAGMIVGSTQVSARLMHRVPARVLMVPGLLVGALGMYVLTRMEVGSSYTGLVLPAELLISVGLGTSMMPAMNLATSGVAPRDAGVASAMVNTAQQVGGSIGTALLNTIAATATAAYVTSHLAGSASGPRPPAALAAIARVHGYTVAGWWGVGIMLLTAVLVGVLVNGRGAAAPGDLPAQADTARMGSDTSSGGAGREGAASGGAASGGAGSGGAGSGGVASVRAGSVDPRGGGAPAGAFATEGAARAVPDPLAQDAYASGPAGESVGRVAFAAVAAHELPSPSGSGEGGFGDGGATGDRSGGDGPGEYGAAGDGAEKHGPDRHGREHGRPGTDGDMAGWRPAASADVAASPGGGAVPGGRGEIRGRVRGATGIPLPHAALTLVDPGGRQLGRGTAGADGGYVVRAPGAGSYVLIATADGHRPRAVTVVAGGEPLTQDMTLPGTAALAGRVTAAADGTPVAAATVVVTDGRGEVVASGRTGQDGGFSFADLVADAYTLVVSAAGHRPVAEAVEVASRGTTRRDIGLEAGALVRGTVRAGAGNHPLADARVTLVNAAGDVIGATVTDADGAYAFMDLDEGSYTVVASGYPPVAAALMVDGAGASGLDITLGHPAG